MALTPQFSAYKIGLKRASLKGLAIKSKKKGQRQGRSTEALYPVKDATTRKTSQLQGKGVPRVGQPQQRLQFGTKSKISRSTTINYRVVPISPKRWSQRRSVSPITSNETDAKLASRLERSAFGAYHKAPVGSENTITKSAEPSSYHHQVHQSHSTRTKNCTSSPGTARPITSWSLQLRQLFLSYAYCQVLSVC